MVKANLLAGDFWWSFQQTEDKCCLEVIIMIHKVALPWDVIINFDHSNQEIVALSGLGSPESELWVQSPPVPHSHLNSFFGMVYFLLNYFGFPIIKPSFLFM